MSELDVHSIFVFGSPKEAKQFVKREPFSTKFPADKAVKLGQGVLGMACINGSIAGALTKRPNFQDKDQESEIYVLYNRDGQYKIDSEMAESALSDAGIGKRKNRTVSMTDEDHRYLTTIGEGNVSGGIHLAIQAHKNENNDL